MQKENSKIDIERTKNFWIKSSEEDYETMLGLYEIKRYSWALFIGHISVEKLLKAIYVSKKGEHAPYIHNLYRLAELSNLNIAEEYSDLLDKITTFNLKTRYDDYKEEFAKQCTPEFTGYWIEKIKIIRTWINQML